MPVLRHTLMRRAKLALMVPACALVLAACGTETDDTTPGTDPTGQPADTGDETPEPGSPGTDAPADLDGQEFLLDTATGDTDLADDIEVGLRFDDGVVYVQDGCNGLGGDYALSDGVLQVTGEVARTDMGCPDLDEHTAWLDDFIRAEPTIDIDGTTVVLTGDEAELTFIDRTEAIPDRELVGTTWIVDGYTAGSGPDAPATTVNGETEVTFTEDGTVNIQICNSGSGSYEVEGDTISFGQIAMTMMACTDTRGEAEDVFATMLAEDVEVTFAIDGERLTITGPDGSLNLVADRGSLDPDAGDDDPVDTDDWATESAEPEAPGADAETPETGSSG